jgi:CubicO group peptidase (beta-lactamase class C family)
VSITKTFTAYAAVQAVADADIGLDEPVAAVLGPVKLSQAADAGQVTFRPLLTHTAGWDSGGYIYAHRDIRSFGRSRDGKEA